MYISKIKITKSMYIIFFQTIIAACAYPWVVGVARRGVWARGGGPPAIMSTLIS